VCVVCLCEYADETVSTVCLVSAIGDLAGRVALGVCGLVYDLAGVCVDDTVGSGGLDGVHGVSLCVVCVVLTMVMHGMIQSYGIIGTIASVFCGVDAFCGAVMRFFLCQPLPSPRMTSTKEPGLPSTRWGAVERTLLIF
jgi:hypothetical protein